MGGWRQLISGSERRVRIAIWEGNMIPGSQRSYLHAALIGTTPE